MNNRMTSALQFACIKLSAFIGVLAPGHRGPPGPSPGNIPILPEWVACAVY